MKVKILSHGEIKKKLTKTSPEGGINPCPISKGPIGMASLK